MSEQAYESLSALMDNETDELEIRRLLKQYLDQPALQEKWARYQLVSSVLNAENATVLDIDLSNKIAQQIDAEPSHQLLNELSASKSVARRFIRPMGSVAIAASVTFLVVFGAQRISVLEGGNPPESGYASQSGQSTFQIDESMLNSRNAPNYFSGNGAAHLTSTGDETSTVNRTRSVREYVPNNQNKIQHVSVKPIENVDLYLQQHARNAISTGMGGIPFAKTAAFEVQQ